MVSSLNCLQLWLRTFFGGHITYVIMGPFYLQVFSQKSLLVPGALLARYAPALLIWRNKQLFEQYVKISIIRGTLDVQKPNVPFQIWFGYRTCGFRSFSSFGFVFLGSTVYVCALSIICSLTEITSQVKRERNILYIKA